MNCELARDLIILYAEDLCSDKTAEELKAHLEQCSECSKRLEEYKKELEGNKEENKRQNDKNSIEELKPMKKVKKKLVMGKVKVAILCVVLVVIVSGLGFLSFGEATNECLSFSAISDAVKIKSVCKSLSKGDTEPIMDILAYRVKDQYAVNGSENFTDYEAYKAQVEKDMTTAYEYYFAGKSVTVKIVGIDQYPYAEEAPTDSTNTDITIGFFEKDNLLYELAFGEVNADKFIVYELPRSGEPTFTTSILPYYDTSLDICLHYATKKAYTDLTEEKTEKAGAGLALAVTKEGTDEEKEAYRTHIMEKMQMLCDEGWYYKDVMYFVDEYDTKAGKWIYKVWFMLEEQSSGNVVMLEQKFHYYRNQLYVINSSQAVIIGTEGEVSADIKTQMQNVFR